MRRSVATLAALALAALLAGCGLRSEPVGAHAGMFPVIITGGDGAVLVLRASPRRIVSADAAATAVLQALGVSGVTASSPPQALAAVGADLTILPAAYTGPRPRGPVMVWSNPTLTGPGRMITMLGLATGRGAAGVALGRRVDAAVMQILGRARAQPPVSIVIDAGGLNGVGPETTLGAFVQKLAARNILSVSGPLTITLLGRRDPQVWFEVAPGSTTLGQLRALPGLRGLRAIKDGRVALIDPSLLEPAPTLPATLEALVMVLHPGA